MTKKIKCRVPEPAHDHEYPDDWGMTEEGDPRADPRWQGTVYLYFDDRLNLIHSTVVPVCDEDALDFFSNVARFGPLYRPCYVQAKRPDGTLEMLPYQYNKADDTVSPIQKGA